jgi:hypothetical protein
MWYHAAAKSGGARDSPEARQVIEDPEFLTVDDVLDLHGDLLPIAFDLRTVERDASSRRAVASID